LLRKINFFVFAFTFLLSCNANALETEAKQAVLMDFATGEILFDKNADERMGPSSMTKIMTAYVIFDGLKKGDFDMDTKFSVSKNAWKTGGSRSFVELNSQVALSDLIQGIIVQSGNDACVTVAEGYAGSVESFSEEMNEKAKEMGLKNSRFTNPHGLTDENHYSSARDLAIIAQQLIKKFPEYYHYFGQKDFTYNKIRQQNRNALLYNSALGVDGLKTGHTEASGYGIVTSAAKNDLRLIAVVNGLSSPRKRIEESQKLLSYGFINYKNLKLYSKGEVVENIKVWHGVQDKISAIAKEDVEILVPRRKSAREGYEFKVKYNEPLYAPIKQGDKIALLQIYSNNKLKVEVPLYAERAIDSAGFAKSIKDKIKLFLGNNIQ
jgi:D-alanyl-D-alanine carboxypeptidase (penicillin-binding protein 5/6)